MRDIMIGVKEKWRENVNCFALGSVTAMREYGNEIFWLHK
jgi:hypothetical protein